VEISSLDAGCAVAAYKLEIPLVPTVLIDQLDDDLTLACG
jgi:hypothetical protein